MYGANPITYLSNILDEMAVHWPNNRTINIVCHGHSVPAGYFATPYVDTFHAYPHLLHRLIKERFPFAVTNVIVTAIGGENARSGSLRFDDEVLCHRPDVLTIDYGLNDRGYSIGEAEASWRSMIERALAKNVCVILLTPTLDQTYFARDEMWRALEDRAKMIRRLADEYQVGLADSFAVLTNAIREEADIVGLLSHVNHPSFRAHAMVAQEVGKFFLPR